MHSHITVCRHTSQVLQHYRQLGQSRPLQPCSQRDQSPQHLHIKCSSTVLLLCAIDLLLGVGGLGEIFLVKYHNYAQVEPKNVNAYTWDLSQCCCSGTPVNILNKRTFQSTWTKAIGSRFTFVGLNFQSNMRFPLSVTTGPCINIILQSTMLNETSDLLLFSVPFSVQQPHPFSPAST